VAVNVLSTITDYAVNYPEQLYDYFKSAGIQWIQFFPALDTKTSGLDKTRSFAPDPKAYGRFLTIMFDLWIQDYTSGKEAPVIRFFENVFHSYVGLASPECTFMKTCGVYLVAEHNGDIYSCDYYVDHPYKLGSIHQNELIEMLNGQPQQLFGEAKNKLHASCVSCKWLKLCNGGCPRYRSAGAYFYCESMKMFFTHTNETFKFLAAQWLQNQTRHAAYDFSRHII
jgi:uncharacterized protein